MKRRIVILLLCINAALLAALIWSATERPAYGQALGTDYVVVTGHVGVEWDAVYVLDLAKRRLAAFGVDKTRMRVRAFVGWRDLVRDFQRPRTVTPTPGPRE